MLNGDYWGTWGLSISDGIIEKLVDIASKEPSIVDRYNHDLSVYGPQEFNDFCTEEGYAAFFIEMLNLRKYGGKEVFEGNRFIGVSAVTMVEKTLSKADVENVLREFLTELGEEQELEFKWAFYCTDAPNSSEF